MVDEGETDTLVPDKPPGIQLYVFPPVPVSVVDAPLQIVGKEALAEIVGEVFTVTVTVLEFVHPLVVPVTVYVVVETGETVTLVPDKLPGIHA